MFEIEKNMLSLLVCYKECLEKGICDLTEEDFGEVRCKEVFKLIMADYMKGADVSPVAFYSRNKERMDYIFGSFAGAALLDPNSMPFEYDGFLKILQENKSKRKIQELADKLGKKLAKGSTAEEMNTLIEQHVFNYQPSANREYLSPEQIANKCLDVITERMDDAKRNKKVLYTGFRKLNYRTGGFENGDLVILSGKTGGGKSAFAANLVRDVAIVQKKPVLYLNSEMSAAQMALRWSALLSNVSHTSLRNGQVSNDELKTIMEKLNILYESKLYTVTIPDLKITSVISEIKRAKKQHDIRLAVVDYIGRVDMENASKEDWQVMTGAARKLKTIAQQEDIVVIMIAQLNAKGDLAQASYMTHEADLWLNIEQAEKSDGWGNTKIRAKKARNAATGGALTLEFDGDKLTFCES